MRQAVEVDRATSEAPENPLLAGHCPHNSTIKLNRAQDADGNAAKKRLCGLKGGKLSRTSLRLSIL